MPSEPFGDTKNAENKNNGSGVLSFIKVLFYFHLTK